MLSGNGVKTVRCSYDALHDPLRLTMLSGNGAQDNTLCFSPGIAVHLDRLSRRVGDTVVQTGTEVLLDTASCTVGQ